MKKVMKKVLFFVFIGFLTITSAVSLASQDTIKIGAILAVTGPASFLGDPELKTLQLYVDEVNEQGGVLGKKLELVHYDNGANPQKAVSFVKRLINQDEVVAIIGPSATGDTMAMTPFAQRAEIPVISLGGGLPIIEPVKEFIFKTPATDKMACEKIFEYLQNEKIKNVALISGTDGFEKSMRNQCIKAAPKYGVKILADETYGNKDTDMTPQLTKIKNTPNVEAVINPGFGQGPVIVTKNFKQLGMSQILIQSHGVASNKFIELTGSAGEGVLVVSPPILVAKLLEDSNPIKELTLDYIQKYEKTYNQPISTFGGYAHDALTLLVDAIKRAKSTNGKAIQKALETTQNLPGVNGVFTMSKDDHLGLGINSSMKILAIKNGGWEIVGD